MAVLSIEETTIDDQHVTVTAIIEDMRLLYKATRDTPDEWCPALCRTSFELDDDTQVPFDEDGFCSYLDQLDLNWELVDTSDYELDQ